MRPGSGLLRQINTNAIITQIISISRQNAAQTSITIHWILYTRHSEQLHYVHIVLISVSKPGPWGGLHPSRLPIHPAPLPRGGGRLHPGSVSQQTGGPLYRQAAPYIDRRHHIQTALCTNQVFTLHGSVCHSTSYCRECYVLLVRSQSVIRARTGILGI